MKKQLLLDIECSMPFFKSVSDSDYDVVINMMTALIHRYSNHKGTTSLPYWIDKFSTPHNANKLLYALAKAGIIITSVPKQNWAEVRIDQNYLLSNYTQEELNKFIIETKMAKYSLNCDKHSIMEGATDVALPSGITKTGLCKIGFAKASLNEFSYDIPMLKKYYHEVVAVSVKSMTKMEELLGYSLTAEEGYDYGSIVKAVIDDIIAVDRRYNLGRLTLDSRGRAIYDATRKCFNPISNKMARALVVAPASEIDEKAKYNAFLFIAELTSGFTPDIAKKHAKGVNAYNKRKLNKIAKGDLDDLFENIWLERMYADMEKVEADPKHLVTTPIELDFSASNMCIIGLLLGHQDYINPNKYMWKIDGLTKLQVKTAQTPYVFGSSASVETLWRNKGLSFSTEQVFAMRKAQLHGKFSIANRFKDILIGNSRPEATMVLDTFFDKYRVECNRFTNVGDTTKQYVLYDSVAKKMKVITHTTTHKVPDLQQFRRYFSTGLVHNIDNVIMNSICKDVGWILPIHDAGVICWKDAEPMRESAVDAMHMVHNANRTIVEKYLKSINLDDRGWKLYYELLADIAELNRKPISISPYLLK